MVYNPGSAENDDAPAADPEGYNPGAAEDPETNPELTEPESETESEPEPEVAPEPEVES